MTGSIAMLILGAVLIASIGLLPFNGKRESARVKLAALALGCIGIVLMTIGYIDVEARVRKSAATSDFHK